MRELHEEYAALKKSKSRECESSGETNVFPGQRENAVDGDQRRPRLHQSPKEDWTRRKNVRGGRRLGLQGKKEIETEDERDGDI